MTRTRPRPIALAAFLAAAAFAGPAPAGETQVATSAAEPVALGAGGYVLHFQFQWSCDDNHSGTTSSPGRIDLVDPSGVTLAQVAGTAGAGGPSVGAPAVGVLSNVASSVASAGAGGTPADALLSGTWRVPGLGPGAYSFRFWTYEDWIAGRVATTITTFASDAGGGGPVSPPSVTLSAPPAATVFLPLAVSATATQGANGSPLASVAIDMSADGGATWSPVLANAQSASPSDTEQATPSFAHAGSALLRATATDTGGLQASTEQPVAVARAAQGGVAISPAALSLTAGQSAAFAASGGATGNYAWSGSAAGSGTAQSVAFPLPGIYNVSVLDSGSADYDSSPAATATVAVQAAFYVLSVAATPGGTVSGGGSYPPGAQATAVATPGPGQLFAGWTGDATGASPALSVLMDSSKSVTADFAPLLAQTISFSPPGTVTTRSPPVALSATSSSGLPVAIALDSGPASLSGSLLTPAGAAGPVTLTATQPGNAQYLPAAPVTISFPIGSPPAGVLLADDSSLTKRTDRYTRNTSFRSGPAQ